MLSEIFEIGSDLSHQQDLIASKNGTNTFRDTPDEYISTQIYTTSLLDETREKYGSGDDIKNGQFLMIVGAVSGVSIVLGIIVFVCVKCANGQGEDLVNYDIDLDHV